MVNPRDTYTSATFFDILLATPIVTVLAPAAAPSPAVVAVATVRAVDPAANARGARGPSKPAAAPKTPAAIVAPRATLES